MDSPRTRSVDRALPGYGIREESKKNPNGFRGSRNPGRDGRGRERLYNPETYHAKHFPDESFGAVQACAFAESARQHHREYPDPAAVLQRLEEKGWLRGQAQA